MGNILNKANAQSFSIESLVKLSSVKDNSSKKTLLHIIIQKVLEEKECEQLSKKFENICKVAKSDFADIESKLKLMEEQCKSALGYLKLGASYDSATRTLVEEFLTDSVKEIVSINIVIKLMNKTFAEFLFWLGELLMILQCPLIL